MMATYFNGGSEIQADHLQTLYLMNPSYAATYSDAQQHLVGIPLAQSGSGTPGADLGRPSSFHEIPGSAAAGGPRFHYNLWGAADPSSSGGRAQNQIPTAFSVSELGSPMGFCRGPSNQGLSPNQGLSLSLKNSSPAHTNAAAAAALSPGGGGSLKSASGVSVGVGGSPQSLILGSKYLKATQELLDEVVSMADSGASGAHREKEKEKAKAKAEISSDEDGASKGGVCELSSAQRQELQMKKAKLLNMLDEVEQRYKQYQMQMHRVGSELEQGAGLWSAKSYTSLALHTISKQFRCLKDAIASQVKETGRRMGEEEDEKEGRSTSTRLRMVEQQLRQQRAMQQLGMMHNQHNAWRPQRGLPERAVSVLRAWLFEHFLHPYPKDLDKHMLAKQTGLTRSQVSNWFINARVRLWKPMVEEMYVEEMKGAGHNQNDSDEANNNDPNKEYSSLTQKSTPPLQSHNHMSNPKPPPPPPPNNSVINDIPNSTLVSPSSGPTSGPTLHTIGPDLSLIRSSSSGMESIFIQRSPKRQRNSVLNIHSPSSILSMDMKDDPNNNRDLFTTPDGGFEPNNYPVADHIRSRFNPDNPHHQLGQNQYHHHAGNAVSLTLGLPHCENMLSLSGAHHHQQNFFSGQAMQLGRRLDMGEPEWCGSQPGPHSGAGDGGYEGSVDTQTGKRFAAQLLPDFVA